MQRSRRRTGRLALPGRNVFGPAQIKKWQILGIAALLIGLGIGATCWTTPSAASPEDDGSICKTQPQDDPLRTACWAVMLQCMMLSGDGSGNYDNCVRKNFPGIMARLNRVSRSMRNQYSSPPDDPGRALLRDKCENGHDVAIVLPACTKLIRTDNGSDPDLFKYLGNRAGAYIEKQQFDAAIADLTRAIQLKPDDEMSLKARGLVRFHLAISPEIPGDKAWRIKQYGLALADFDSAVAADSSDTEALYYRGLTEGTIGAITKDTGLAARGASDIRSARAIDPNIGR